MSLTSKPVPHKITPWLLLTLVILGVVIQLVVWAIHLTGRPSLFEWVEVLGWGAMIPLAFSIPAALITARQPENRLGWLMMMIALATGNPLRGFSEFIFTSPTQLTPSLFLLLWLDGWSWIPVIFPVFLIPLHFPTGRPPSPRWNWVNHLAIGMWLFFILFIPLLQEVGPINGQWVTPNPIGFIPSDIFNGPVGMLWGLGLVTIAAASVLSLFIRFRHASSIVRQQIKWLLFAGGLFTGFYAYIYFFVPVVSGWMNLLFVGFILTLPMAIGVAILHYRLFDIDLIIRRSLQYSLVTGVLSLIYFGGVALLQAVVGGQSSPAIIVITTLAIAALFNPLRRRIQDFIDRRFYRQKYNAEQALAEFAAAARSEANLDQLSRRLISTIQETIQPESTSLWLAKIRPLRE